MRTIIPMILRNRKISVNDERKESRGNIIDFKTRRKKPPTNPRDLPALSGYRIEGVFSGSFLQKLLKFARVLIPKNSANPAFKTVRFSGQNGFSAVVTDLENMAEVKADRDEGRGRGTVLIPFGLLSRIYKAKPRHIRFWTENGQGYVGYESQGISRKEKFRVIPLEEYPDTRVPSKGFKQIDCNLAAYIQEASTFTADPANKIATCGVLLDGVKNRIVGTDGKRLYCRDKIPLSVSERIIIPPNKVLQYLDADSCSVLRNDRILWIKSGVTTLGLMVMEGTFPDYEKVLKFDLNPYKTIWKISPKDRKTLVKLLPSLAYEKKEVPALNLKFNKDRLSLHTGKGGAGEFRTLVYGSTECRVNAAYFRDILKVEDIQECRLSDGANKPIVFNGKRGVEMLLMPLMET